MDELIKADVTITLPDDKEVVCNAQAEDLNEILLSVRVLYPEATWVTITLKF